MKHVVIGSRGSDLALWQAHFVKSELEKLGCTVELNIIKTQGDAIQHLSFDKLEGKGFFTKEIEDALLSKQVDLAVHSHKDLETTPPTGLKIACVSERANPADILLIRKESVDANQKWSLKCDAIIGTSSARRKSQVLKYRPDTTINDLRGNVPTRIDKLRQGNYDAILLAKAGVDRLELDLSEFVEIVLDPTEFVPAPAQGVLGLQIRNEDDELNTILQKINFQAVKKRIDLERKVLNLLDGGCQLPLGVYCDEAHNLYVSYANGLEGECTQLHYHVEKFEGMAEKVIADLIK
ncbi:MAG: hydroxymethylbilane synthase [Crocinitomicaceae bacterium]|nr:hydroxymethylbilane synthase [Crocinitomicaceae bacterium]MDG1776181.1 hydroxymethylbilane synthase [Crocinitomicaceae bacterium]